MQTAEYHISTEFRQTTLIPEKWALSVPKPKNLKPTSAFLKITNWMVEYHRNIIHIYWQTHHLILCKGKPPLFPCPGKAQPSRVEEVDLIKQASP